MPTFIIVEGIKIEYFSGDHLPPHIHASYAEFEVLIIIQTQVVYQGSMPAKKLKVAKEIVKENKEDLSFLFDTSNPNLRKKK
ncbi:DUF4160 domain-containing protein [Flavobacterium sp. N1736]|uniref:DUF4160 domain-containing protein n=1 Tax=Flavobacterium sp. N1736 TaxID=2986823 RepID=UPI0022252D95|nr:DUF4160 domain-containing protein [Flavobacterium sp. N1736]